MENNTPVTLPDEVKAQIVVSLNFNDDGSVGSASGQKQTVDVTAGEDPKDDGAPNDLFVSQAAKDQYATDIATAINNLKKNIVADNYQNGAFVAQTTTTTTVEETTTTSTEEATITTTVEETTTTTTEDASLLGSETTETTTEGDTETTTAAPEDTTTTTEAPAEETTETTTINPNGGDVEVLDTTTTTVAEG